MKFKINLITMCILYSTITTGVWREGGASATGGGHLARCTKTEHPPHNDFVGLYSIDYLLTYKKKNNNNDIAPIKDWNESKKRIYPLLEKSLPLLAQSFKEFLKYENNESDPALEILWDEASFGHLYIDDQKIEKNLPKNCEVVKDKEEKTIPFIIRKKFRNNVIFSYDSTLHDELKEKNPDQISWAMIHEWLREHTDDPRVIRRVNRILHSNYLKNNPHKLAKALHNSGLGIAYEEGKSEEKMLDLIVKKTNLNELVHLEILIFAYSEQLDLDKKFDLPGGGWKGKNSLTEWKLTDRVLLNLAIENKKYQIAKDLIKAGAKINDTRDGYGVNPLNSSTRVCHQGLTYLLLKKGADINHSDRYGVTPLMNVTKCDQLDLFKFFVDNGADFKALDQDGWSVLFYAVLQSQDLVKAVLALNIDPNLRSTKETVRHPKGMTAILYGLRVYHLFRDKKFPVSILKVLLENNADANIVDDMFGESPLMLAVVSENFEAVKELVLNGKARVNLCRKSDNKSAYDLAKNSPAIRAFLKKHGGKPCKS